MRFMMFMYPNIPADVDWTPTADDVAEMMRYNEELAKAGVLLGLDGLHPPEEGFRVSGTTGNVTVTDGPFAEAKEVVGGYWIIDVKSKEEAVEWASRCPMDGNCFIEVRRIFELEDFPQDVQEAASVDLGI